MQLRQPRVVVGDRDGEPVGCQRQPYRAVLVGPCVAVHVTEQLADAERRRGDERIETPVTELGGDDPADLLDPVRMRVEFERTFSVGLHDHGCDSLRGEGRTPRGGSGPCAAPMGTPERNCVE
jgi:hypothetical protein